jgi:hypothetical protein
MHFQNKILHQRTLRTIYDTLSLTNTTVLTADTILWCTEILFQTDDFHFLCHKKKNVIPSSYRTLVSHQTSYTH